MWATDSVDTAMALYEAHRIPRKIVVDDVPRLLKVDAFRQYIRCYHQIEAIGISARGSLAGARRKAEDGVFAGKTARGAISRDRDETSSVVRESLVCLDRLA